MTPGDLLTWVSNEFKGADLFYGHGTDNADDEAAYLVLRSLDIPFDAEDDIFKTPLTDLELNKVKSLVKRRIEERKPVAYLINEAWFAGLTFYVDERVLVPRSPIAELIEERFYPWIEESSVSRILDIGTGSGCIAIAAALAFPRAEIDAVDISFDALTVAKKNIMQHQLQERVKPMKSDLFQELGGWKYDLIIANPPYVGKSEVNELPDEYRHEPVLGLEAGTDGMDIVRRLLLESRSHLNEHGVLVVEVGHSRDAFCSAFPELVVTWLEFERGGDGVFLITYNELTSFFD